MRPRHAAALALVGFYLMVPPQIFSSGYGTVNVNANEPLSKWNYMARFRYSHRVRVAT